jgi:guanosine-3',5'-bis(diphosphate) 3'-pyrophosphohydrolase
MTPEDSVDLLLRATVFAAHQHRHQTRKGDGAPYINHPIRVAHTVSNLAGVREGWIVAAAMLHDTVEDTDATLDEIERTFGARVAGIVGEVTDDRSLPKVKRKQLQIEHGPHMSEASRIVKLADKLDNLRDMTVSPPQGWSPDRVLGYCCWAYHVVEGLGSASPPLRRELDFLFSASLTIGGRSYPMIPADAEARRTVLEAYYRDLASAAD